MKNYIKNLIRILCIVFVLLVITLINIFNKNIAERPEVLYKNELSTKITNNDINDINYEFLNKDLNSIDDILKEQLSLELDTRKKTQYYMKAQEIYSQKINEYMMVLNYKLDDEDFHRLELDIDDFQKNIDSAIEDISITLDSSIDIELYTNKYLYEEKQKKCREILESYKGFLN